MNKNSHTFLDGNNKNFVCQKCGATQKIELPMPISKMVEKINAFNVLHQDCK